MAPNSAWSERGSPRLSRLEQRGLPRFGGHAKEMAELGLACRVGQTRLCVPLDLGGAPFFPGEGDRSGGDL